MSAFYGAYDGDMRNWFVGTLCAVGAFMVLYKGFTFAEEMALNAAGLSAALVAMTPCNCWADRRPWLKRDWPSGGGYCGSR
jgi:hypothetical protein